MSGKKVIYTMYASPGAIKKNGESRTPVGNYRIQEEAGEVFYNNDGVGARYCVSYDQHGVSTSSTQSRSTTSIPGLRPANTTMATRAEPT